IAADVRAGQAKSLPQKIDKQSTVFDIGAHALAVHRHADQRHRSVFRIAARGTFFSSRQTRSSHYNATPKRTSRITMTPINPIPQISGANPSRGAVFDAAAGSTNGGGTDDGESSL